jgi:hypothetical protein
MFYSISLGTLFRYEISARKYIFNLSLLKPNITYIAVVGGWGKSSDVLKGMPNINVLYFGPMSINTSPQHISEEKRLRQQIIIFELCEQPQVDAPDVQKEVKTPVVTTF